jgi:cytochrome c peroxidase
VLKSEFRCGGPNSQQKECRKLRHLNPDYEDFIGAFKTPSLREVSKTAPYMHSGEFNTLEEVLNFYNTMPGTVQLGHRELFLKPLHLKPAELADLKSFL